MLQKMIYLMWPYQVEGQRDQWLLKVCLSLGPNMRVRVKLNARDIHGLAFSQSVVSHIQPIPHHYPVQHCLSSRSVHTVVSQLINPSSGHKFLLWQRVLSLVVPGASAISSSRRIFLGKFLCLGVHGFNHLIT